MTAYSAEYLQGILDARATLQLAAPIAPAAVAREEMAFIERVSSLAGSALHRDYLAGLRDFWNHQLTKGAQ